jgi:hypothetical protein
LRQGTFCLKAAIAEGNEIGQICLIPLRRTVHEPTKPPTNEQN